MTNHIGLLYVEYETELLWLIGEGMVYNKEKIGQQRDWSYRCSLHWNQNRIIMTDRIKCGLSWKVDKTMMWPIIQGWSK